MIALGKNIAPRTHPPKPFFLPCQEGKIVFYLTLNVPGSNQRLNLYSNSKSRSKLTSEFLTKKKILGEDCFQVTYACRIWKIIQPKIPVYSVFDFSAKNNIVYKNNPLSFLRLRLKQLCI